jgi:LysR family transcriptional regulator (chromosome initiation inhibitor)
MAAITAEADPVPGCTSTPLGRMTYRPMSTPAFAARWFPDGPTAEALAAAPVVVFDRKDDLQHRYLRRRAGPVDPPAHYVPASADYVRAVGLGYGWGMVLDLQRERAGADLTELDLGGAVEVDLHWQQWKLRSASLDRVRSAVLDAAAAALAAEVRR